VSAGNIDHDDRVSLIAVDYPNRQRMKLYGRARFDPSPTADELAAVGFAGRGEGIVTVEVVAFAWNCPKYITPRFTADQIRSVVEPLQQRIAELEHQLSEQVAS
jgi:hypothetical protein